MVWPRPQHVHVHVLGVWLPSGASMPQVADLQVNLKQEQIIVEEKKAKTGALIETIGQEKAVVDDAVEAGREDEEAAAKLQVGCML